MSTSGFRALQGCSKQNPWMEIQKLDISTPCDESKCSSNSTKSDAEEKLHVWSLLRAPGTKQLHGRHKIITRGVWNWLINHFLGLCLAYAFIDCSAVKRNKVACPRIELRTTWMLWNTKNNNLPAELSSHTVWEVFDYFDMQCLHMIWDTSHFACPQKVK